jgi:transcription antitermination factor NusG
VQLLSEANIQELTSTSDISATLASQKFELLQQHNGKFTSVNGSTQIRAGVIRPEIVIPLTVEDAMGSKSEKDTASGISAGSMVRVIRAPYFGDIGTVVSLPAELQQMESETMVRVAEVEISGETLVIPRANLEMVETS